MPKGPNGQKRPTDANQLASVIVSLATGDVKEAKSLPRGKAGAMARKASLTPEQRSEIAKMAAAKRWEKQG